MTKPYVRITVDGPKLSWDTNHPLPKPLPEGVVLTKGPTYSWCAGSVAFGGELYFEWEITTTEELPREAYHALLNQGWTLRPGGKKRRFLLDGGVLTIPSKEARPEVWPPAGLTLVRSQDHVDFVMAEVVKPAPPLWGFYISVDQYPVFPLLTFGQLWTAGWDIPTHYAIDANRQCWMDSGHGANLVPVEPSALLSEAERPEIQEEIRKYLAMKPKLPSWVHSARAAGWVPPEGWDESGYEV